MAMFAAMLNNEKKNQNESLATSREENKIAFESLKFIAASAH